MSYTGVSIIVNPTTPVSTIVHNIYSIEFLLYSVYYLVDLRRCRCDFCPLTEPKPFVFLSFPVLLCLD